MCKYAYWGGSNSFFLGLRFECTTWRSPNAGLGGKRSSMHTYTFFGRPFQTLPMQCTVQLWSHISTTHTRQTSADLYCCVPKFILCKIYCDANFLISSANYLKRIESIYQNKVGKNNAWFIYIFSIDLTGRYQLNLISKCRFVKM